MAEQLRELAGRERPVWAVTHSMGGIVLRHIMLLEVQGAAFGDCLLLLSCEHPPDGCQVGKTFVLQATSTGLALF